MEKQMANHLGRLFWGLLMLNAVGAKCLPIYHFQIPWRVMA